MSSLVAINLLAILCPVMPHSDVMADLQARYNAMSAAAAHKDIDSLFLAYAKNYWEKDAAGTRTLREVIADARRKSQRWVTAQLNFKVDSVDIKGSGAVAYLSYSFIIVRRAPDGALQMGEGVGKYQDTWNKRTGRWLLQSSVERSMHMRLDGQAYNPYES